MDSALTTPATQDSARAPPPLAQARPIAIARWLLLVAALVFAILVVGGITRLTESGLSITQWNLVGGILPPLDHAGWMAEFARYQATPEYRQVNGPSGMDLAAFQRIYFWEWLHRLLGRLVGLAILLPLAWFAWRRAIPRGYGRRLSALVLLVGFQGALGWYMVQSGLVNRTDVSHFRLSAHLLTALFLFAGLIWTALDLRRLASDLTSHAARLTPIAFAVIAVLAIQLLLGAWVAGLDAGQVASSWPLMNDHFIPQGIDTGRGALFALTHDPYLIHFVHRWWAWVLVIALIVLARRVRTLDRRASIAIHAALGTQILLGIATVMSGVALPLAALHQAVGALLVAATVWGTHVIGQTPSHQPEHSPVS